MAKVSVLPSWQLAVIALAGTTVAVVAEALADPALRLRKAALELVESLGENGKRFAEAVRQRERLEEDAESGQILARLIDRLSPPPGIPPA